MLQYYTLGTGFGGFSSILEQFFPGIIMYVHRFSMLQYLHTTHWVWRIFLYIGTILSWDYYVQDATLINIIEGFFHRTFCPAGPFVPRTFCPWGHFVPLDVSSQGHFVPLDVLSQGRFVPGRLVSGRFVYVPDNLFCFSLLWGFKNKWNISEIMLQFSFTVIPAVHIIHAFHYIIMSLHKGSKRAKFEIRICVVAFKSLHRLQQEFNPPM
jgi:hypothetical protein